MITSDRLSWLLDTIERSLDEPELTGADVAGRAYLSRFHFDRLVAAAVGESPGALRRRLLLERAAHTLATSDASVAEIAHDTGYRSPEAFARAFGRAYGGPPRAYRRSGRMTHDLPAPSGSTSIPPAACGCRRPKGAAPWMS